MSFFCTFAHIDLWYYSCYLLLNCQMFRHKFVQKSVCCLSVGVGFEFILPSN